MKKLKIKREFQEGVPGKDPFFPMACGLCGRALADHNNRVCPVSTWKAEQPQHTPTPWTVTHQTATDGTNDIVSNGRVIAHLGGCLAGDSVHEANAAFIVRAVNSHDALVEIAKKLYEELIEAHGKDWAGYHTASKYHEVMTQAEGK